MTSRPILFAAPMIKALLREQDPKLMTRRTRGLDKLPADAKLLGDCNGVWQFYSESTNESFFVRCPFGEPGDHLWVKENAWISPVNFVRGSEATHHDDKGMLRLVSYAATAGNKGDEARCARDYGVKLSPSIFMPRWASRITLELTGVKVERVQDISEEDARAEGVVLGEPVPVNIIVKQRGKKTERSKGVVHDFTYRGAFCRLWGAINGAESWQANPFCWVLSFRRVAQEVATNG